MKTYKEISDELRNVKWKVIPCESGKICWCRVIVPTEDIYYDNKTKDEKISICHAGDISKYLADHIVHIHNKYIDDKLKEK